VSISEIGIPEGVREVLAQRLDRLGPDAAEVLQCAAVVGREFEVEVVTNAADTDARTVVDAVDAARASRLVEDAGVDRFRFSHALVRQTLYDEVSSSRRIRLHRRIAHHLEDRGGATVVELAYHYAEAAPLGEAERAVLWLQRAGGEAIQRLAFDEAVEFFGRALEADDLLDPRDPARRAELLIARGDARNRVGEPGPARHDFVDAATLARTSHRPDLLAVVACGYGGAAGVFVDPTDSVGPALTAEALAALEPGDSSLRCRLLLRRSMWLGLNPDPAERHAVSTEAVAMARRLGDAETLLAALSDRSIALREGNRAQEQLMIADEMLALARKIGSVTGECDAHERRASALAKIGDLALMAEAGHQVRRLASETRMAERQWSAAAILAIVAILRGNFEDALALIAEEARFAPAYGEIGELTVGLHHHLLSLARGDTQRCAALLRQLCDAHPIFTVVYPAEVDIARWEGRLDDSRAALDAWWNGVLPFLPAQFRAYTLTSMAQSATIIGTPDIVEAIARELLPRAGTWTGSPSELTFYCVDHALAWCSLAMHDEDAGEQHLRNAITFYDRAGSPVLVSHAVADLAELGRAEPAALERSIAIAEALDLYGIAARLRSVTR
jgi:tetratricopeptide (TPR) repeat protein